MEGSAEKNMQKDKRAQAQRTDRVECARGDEFTRRSSAESKAGEEVEPPVEEQMEGARVEA